MPKDALGDKLERQVEQIKDQLAKAVRRADPGHLLPYIRTVPVARDLRLCHANPSGEPGGVLLADDEPRFRHPYDVRPRGL
jgi:hypothetical protein